MVYVGIDVAAASLMVARVNGDEHRRRSFSNTVGGRERLIAWLLEPGVPVRVVLEATGVYSQSIVWDLHHCQDIEVMVANPRAVKHFASANMTRAKTDAVDAECIAAFAQQMRFSPWQPPAVDALRLRQISRRIRQLKGHIAAERNRLHAEQHAAVDTLVVMQDITMTIAFLEQRINTLQQEAMALIQADAELAKAYPLLLTICGIADTAAVSILAEVGCLPKGLTANQWVAHAGLDPRPCQSGSSIDRPGRISKAGNAQLRTALYLPAMVASTRDPHVAAFKKRLTDKGKKPIQAIVAVMRKLLLAIYGMLKRQTPWNPPLAFPLMQN